ISNEEASQVFGGNFNAFTIQQINTSFVGDNAVFGIAAPLQGYRYRVGAEQYFGDYNFTAYTLDVRKYNRYTPVTVAARAYTYMRAGRHENALYPLFLGYPHLFRGYESSSFRNSTGSFNFNSLMGTRIAVVNFELRLPFTGPEKQDVIRSGKLLSDLNLFFHAGFAWSSDSHGAFRRTSRLMGTSIAVVNFELRLPFTGPEKMAVIRSGMLFSDLNLFFDAGLAWSSDSQVAFRSTPRLIDSQPNPTDPSLPPIETYERIPAMSAGVSLRVNLFGAMVLEPYYAFPFQRTDVQFGTFGLNFAPGW